MGLCGSTLTQEEREARERNREIRKQMEDDNAAEGDKMKLLLLGAGESGKSTIFKQMRILHGAGFSQEERMEAKIHIHNNMFEAMRSLCEALERFELLGELQERELCNRFLAMADAAPDFLTQEHADMFKRLWADPAIKQAWERRADLQIIESAKDFLDNIDAVVADDYLPENEYILLSRVRTSGIKEEQFVIDDNIFEFYDVGGQRNERKKWIHCFEDVNAVIFVAALSEYDQVLFEDDSTNRMVEAMELFEGICNNQYFKKTSMILFLNKTDLFRLKIEDESYTTIAEVPAFADFTGKDHDYDDGYRYFLDRFLALNKSGGGGHGDFRKVYVHSTCATDTNLMREVLDDCKEIILHQNLADNGFVN